MSNTEAQQKPRWTKDEIRQFDRLIDQQESRDQVLRISGRLQLREFVKLHGQPKCDAMFAHLEAGGKKEDGPIVTTVNLDPVVVAKPVKSITIKQTIKRDEVQS